MTHKTRTTCRLCGKFDLISVLDLGMQALQGQFPAAEQPDPPSVPLEVVRCPDCGLLQQRHSVDPEAMFRTYWYRSQVSNTMRAHLKQAAEEAAAMLRGRTGEVPVAPRILDIGGNDGTLLNAFPDPTGVRVVLDPSDVPLVHEGITKIRDFFPSGLILSRQYDLVFTIACLYDADSPIGWARSVKKILAVDGLWVVEVADLAAVLRNTDYNYWVHEHACLHSAYTINEIAKVAGLKIVRIETNECNGGSVRCYLTHITSRAYEGNGDWNYAIGAKWTSARELSFDAGAFDLFAKAAKANIASVRATVDSLKAAGKRIHLLAASTKSGVTLQAAKIDHAMVEAASDRDPRKIGRRMPGIGIPVVSEEQSRSMKPDAYLCLMPAAFRPELAAREKAAGTTAELVFGDGERISLAN